MNAWNPPVACDLICMKYVTTEQLARISIISESLANSLTRVKKKKEQY